MKSELKILLLTGALFGCCACEAPKEPRPEPTPDTKMQALTQQIEAARPTPAPQTTATPPPAAQTATGTPTQIVPHLQQPLTDGQNVVWCATLQLAWNELMTLANGPVTMQDQPPLANLLNAATFNKTDLDDASTVAVAGLISDDLLTQLERNLQAKFTVPPATAELRALPPGALFAYAYLNKTLPFAWAFTRFQEPLMFQHTPVTAFGLKQYLPGDANDDKLAAQVQVTDYISDNDFILELLTQSPNDQLLIAQVAPQATLEETLRAVLDRVQRAQPTPLQKFESVIIPVVAFERAQDFPELCGHPLTTAAADLAGKQFDLVRQQLKFTLDETGATLAAKTVFASARPPRQFIVKQPFLLVLKQKNASVPYFVAWLAHPEMFVPIQ